MKYRKIKSGQSIIDAIEFLINCEKDCHIETHRVLNGGAFTRYEWALDENSDVELTYMDEVIIIPRANFESEWQETYANGMFLPSFDIGGDELTVLGDGSSYIGGVGATVYQLDPRYLEAIDEGMPIDSWKSGIDSLPVLAEATHSLEDLVDSTGDFNSSELLTVFELARIALADAQIYDELCDDTDITDEDMKSIQDKLIKHLEAVSS